MKKDKKRSELMPGKFYYLSNHGANSQHIFLRGAHYHIFLGKYSEYLSHCLDTYAYCLLPDQYHFLIRTKPLQLFENEFDVNNQLRKFFISYSLTINKQLSRRGSVFSKYLNIEELSNTKDLKHLVGEIHYFPYSRGLCDSFFNYQFSSFRAMVVPCKTKLVKTEVLTWFSGIENFLEYHRDLYRKREVAVA